MNFQGFRVESGSVRKPNLPAWGPQQLFFQIDTYGAVGNADRNPLYPPSQRGR